MKNNKWKIFISVFTLLLSVLSASLGYGFMGGSDTSFTLKLIGGLVFSFMPVCVMNLLILLWKK